MSQVISLLYPDMITVQEILKEQKYVKACFAKYFRNGIFKILWNVMWFFIIVGMIIFGLIAAAAGAVA